VARRAAALKQRGARGRGPLGLRQQAGTRTRGEDDDLRDGDGAVHGRGSMAAGS
jgi:hypothetical protein